MLIYVCLLSNCKRLTQLIHQTKRLTQLYKIVLVNHLWNRNKRECFELFLLNLPFLCLRERGKHYLILFVGNIFSLFLSCFSFYLCFNIFFFCILFHSSAVAKTKQSNVLFSEKKKRKENTLSLKTNMKQIQNLMFTMLHCRIEKLNMSIENTTNP